MGYFLIRMFFWFTLLFLALAVYLDYKEEGKK